MTTTIDTDSVMCSHLNSYLFQKVWNSPDLEHRQNFILRIESYVPAKYNLEGELTHTAFATPTVNVFTVNNKRIILPNDSRYYMYSVSKCCLGGFNINIPEWVSLADYLNTNPFDLRIHGINGEWLWRKAIYIRNHVASGQLIFAIDADMAERFLNKTDNKYNFMRLCLSVYFDSSSYSTNNNNVYTKQLSPTVECYRPISLEERNSLYTIINTNRSNKITFLNGREASITSASDIKNFDYVEIINDPDIVGRIVLNLTKVGQNNQYRSEVHATYKQIVHIPKALNYNNRIITHHTCDIFIRPVNKANSRLRGLYVHRFNTSDKILITGLETNNANGVYDIVDTTTVLSSRVWLKSVYKLFYNKTSLRWEIINTVTSDVLAYSTSNVGDPVTPNWSPSISVTDYADDLITQITHNDFAISDILLEAYKAALSSDEIELHVVVRSHNKQKPLITDGNFIKYLYRLPDDEIMAFLTGRGDPKLPFWKASYLETSKFTRMLSDVPEFISKTNVSDYINALGYFHTLSALGGRIQKYRINDKLVISNHNEVAANGLYSAIQLNQNYPTSHIWTKGIYKIQYNVISNKWQLYKNNIVIAEQETGTTDPIMSDWYNISDPTDIVFATSYMPRVFSINIPLSLLSSQRLLTHVFLNGLKLDASNYQTFTEHQYITVILNDDVELPYGGELVLELFENPIHSCSIITPTGVLVDTEITNDMDIEVYLHTPIVAIESNHYTNSAVFTQHVSDNTNICTKRKLTEEELSTYITFVEGKLQFKPAAYNKTFTIESSNFYLSKKETINLTTLDKQSIIIGPITISATNLTTETTDDFPIINENSFAIVYLNGRELVENIDFKFVTIRGIDENPVCKIIVISNSEYLVSDDDNIVEYIITTDTPFAKETGFINNRRITKINTLIRYYDNLSMLTQDGLAVKDIDSSQWQLRLTAPAREGAIYYLRSMAPKHTTEFVDKYGIIEGENRQTQDVDLEKLTAITEFFRARTTVDDNLYVIEHSHHIYSVVMNEIIKDVLSGDLVLTYEESATAMLAQVASYLTIERYDPALSGVLNHIKVFGAEQTIVNTSYELQNSTAKGKNRVWYNKELKLMIWYNPTLRKWEIRNNMTVNTLVYYRSAEDITGKLDPWNLSWSISKIIDLSIPILSEIGQTYWDIFIYDAIYLFRGLYTLNNHILTTNKDRVWAKSSLPSSPRIMFHPGLNCWIIGYSTSRYTYISSNDHHGTLGPWNCTWSNVESPGTNLPIFTPAGLVQEQSIIIEGAKISIVNSTYITMHPTHTGFDRVWLNQDVNLRIAYDSELSRWVIRSTVGTQETYYKSTIELTGTIDPWDLNWISTQSVGDATEPILHSGNLNLKYIDLMPSYRHNEAYNQTVYTCLLQLTKFLFPTDATRDGDTINLISE